MRYADERRMIDGAKEALLRLSKAAGVVLPRRSLFEGEQETWHNRFLKALQVNNWIVREGKSGSHNCGYVASDPGYMTLLAESDEEIVKLLWPARVAAQVALPLQQTEAWLDDLPDAEPEPAPETPESDPPSLVEEDVTSQTLEVLSLCADLLTTIRDELAKLHVKVDALTPPTK